MKLRADERGERDRLVFFGPAPSGGAGAQRRVLLIAEALARRGWKVTIVGRSGTGTWFRVKNEGSLKIVEVPGFGRRRLGAACFLLSGAVLGLMQAKRASGYLALQLSSPATAAAICGILSGRPFVVLSSTSGILSESSLMRSGRGARLRQSLLRRAAWLVTQTEMATQELSECFPGANIVTVPNPVETISPPALTGKPRVAYAGRFSEEKDLLTLLKAWELLVRQHPDARLTLVGSGGTFRSVEDDLRTRVASHALLRSTVSFTGWLAHAANAVAQCDVFVFPSLSEGMSNALLEACALGRVIVSSDIPPNVAVLGQDYPLLFSAGDASALEQALEMALDNDDLRARCVAQIAQRRSLFSPEQIAARLESLLLHADRSRHQ